MVKKSEAKRFFYEVPSFHAGKIHVVVASSKEAAAAELARARFYEKAPADVDQKVPAAAIKVAIAKITVAYLNRGIKQVGETEENVGVFSINLDQQEAVN